MHATCMAKQALGDMGSLSPSCTHLPSGVFGLSPLLQTLARTVSGDSIVALTVALLTVHLFLHDYKCVLCVRACVRARVGGAYAMMRCEVPWALGARLDFHYSAAQAGSAHRPSVPP